MEKIFIRSANNYNRREASCTTGLACNDEDCKVKRSFKDECDINNIVKRFGITQELPTSFTPPMSGDFTGVGDFHSALNAVVAAEDAFMQMPAALRKRFSHDPQELMLFLANEANRPEAVKLGLVQPKAEKTRDAVQAIDELAAKIVPRETK